DYRGFPILDFGFWLLGFADRSADLNLVLELGFPSVPRDECHGEHVGTGGEGRQREAESRLVGVGIVRMDVADAGVSLVNESRRRCATVDGDHALRDAGIVERPSVAPRSGPGGLVFLRCVDDAERRVRYPLDLAERLERFSPRGILICRRDAGLERGAA